MKFKQEFPSLKGKVAVLNLRNQETGKVTTEMVCVDRKVLQKYCLDKKKVKQTIEKIPNFLEVNKSISKLYLNKLKEGIKKELEL